MDQLNAPGKEGAARGAVAPLGDAPLALFLDVDGTLLDIAARPEDVVTPAGLVSTLAGAERKLAGALALISGRSATAVPSVSPKISGGWELSTRPSFDSRVEAISCPYWEPTRPSRVLSCVIQGFPGETRAGARAATP